MRDLLALLGIFGLVVTGLGLALKRSIEESVRGIIDTRVGKALADHSHGLERQLEAHRHELGKLSARYSQDYSLFTTERNRVYAQLYAAIERAVGTYAPFFEAITEVRDFTGRRKEDLLDMAEKLEGAMPSEVADLRSLAHNDVTAAGKYATKLHRDIQLRQVERALYRVKRKWILPNIYLSASVDAAVRDIVATLGRMQVLADEMIWGETVSHGERTPLLTKLQNQVGDIRALMRAEMTSSFELDGPPSASPPA